MIIAAVVPIHLLAEERRSVFLRRNEADQQAVVQEEKAHTITRWQRSWEMETRGRWTFRIIPDVRAWLGRKHGEVGYYLTQFLSGHGYFCFYLHKMGKIDTEQCLYCPGHTDDACHTFFICNRWSPLREALVFEVGLFTPETTAEIMLLSNANWQRVTSYINNVLRQKKVDLDRL